MVRITLVVWFACGLQSWRTHESESSSPAGAAKSGSRQRLRIHKSERTHEPELMDFDWRFHRGDFEGQASTPKGLAVAEWLWKGDDRGESAADEMADPNLDTSAGGWKSAPLGQDIFGGRRGFAWFRATLPQVKVGQRRLYFSSVDDDATVYLNGKLVGRHSGWDESFEIPLEAAWREGGTNVVAVLVENSGAGPGGLGQQVLLQSGDNTAAEGPAMPDFDDRSWRTVDIPHDFVVEGTFDPNADRNHGFLPVGVGWYRKEFRLPASDKGKKLWLEFDGIYRNSTLWLNGRFLTRHQSGYTSFHCDITSLARFGGSNVLTVRVDASRFEGWWYEGGGIYRHVWLTRLNPVHLGHWGTFVTSEVPGGDEGKSAEANLTIKTTIANEGHEAVSCGLVSRILDPSGQEVSTQESVVKLKAGETRELTQSSHLMSPALWSIENPNLYCLRTTVFVNGRVVDETWTTFGIRTIRFDADRGFFLNGRPVKIKGTCSHQDFAGVGIALPDRCHVYKIEKLKEMGSNAYRCAHHPHASELLDACDRLGMLVMDENRKLGASQEILSQVESMVLRDRNHPSVILWSLCNEEGAQGTESGAKMFQAMKEVVLRHDRTRPVSCAMNGGFGQGISNLQDLQGFNYNVGAYEGFRAAFPKQPCYGSETASAVATRGVYTEDTQLGYVQAYDAHVGWGNTAEGAWRPIAEREWMAGGFVWTGFDYRGEPSPYGWPCINSHFGILDTCGFPKDSYWYYKSWWGDKPVVHVFPHWNWSGKEGQEIAVWCFSNCERVELLLNGKSLGSKSMPRYGHLEWKVKYEPGALEARGFNGTTLAAKDKTETVGPATRLRLEPDRANLMADGQDVALVAVSVRDEQGRVVPTADNLVTFSVEGPGRLLGVGNGDPSSHEADKSSQRHTFNGYCLVLVQTTKKPGVLRLTARSTDLAEATVNLGSKVRGSLPLLQ